MIEIIGNLLLVAENIGRNAGKQFGRKPLIQNTSKSHKYFPQHFNPHL